MGRINYIQSDFTAGEVSPRINARTDLERYRKGLKTCQNFTVMPQGGVESRPGSIFVAEVADSTEKVRLIRFEFSVEQAYIIEMGAGHFRFYKDTEQIREAAKTITGATAANPVVITSNSHGYSNGDHVYIDSVGGMTELNKTTRRYTVANVTANTFELSGIDGTGFTTYTSGGNVQKVYEITNMFTEAELFEVQFVQSADVIYIVHKDHTPYTLSRTGDTSWTLTPLMKDANETGATLAFKDGPFFDENTTSTTLTPSGVTGSVTITASATTGINNDNGFLTTDVGRQIRIKDAANNWTWLEITARASTTSITATILGGDLSSTAARTTWRLGSWSETTGFPSAITFYEDRLMLASTRDTTYGQPDTIWGSVTSDYLNFSASDPDGTIGDSDGIIFTLNSQEVNVIQWLAPHDTLRVGTAGSTMSVSGSTSTTALSPTNVRSQRDTSRRCAQIAPVSVDNSTLFWDRSERAFYEIRFSFEEDSRVSRDITLVSEHITDDGIVESDYAQRPDSIIWSVRDDGQLIGLTWQPFENVIAWHRHSLGGTSTVVESVATVPTTKDDRVWVSVKRTVDGSTARYVEYFDSRFDIEDVEDLVSYNLYDVPEHGIFSDSSFIFTGEKPATTLTPAAITGTGINFTAGSAVFSSSDVGRQIRSGTGRAVITAFTSTTVVVADIVEDFASTSAIASQSWTLSVNTIDDLYHLEGETLNLLVDGGVQVDATVSGGAVTLDSQYTNVRAGLAYTRILETLDIDAGGLIGSVKGSRADIPLMIVDVYQSVGFDIGSNSTNTRSEEFRETQDRMNLGTPVRTELREVRTVAGYENQAKVYITQTDPLPLTLLGITFKALMSDEI